MEVGSSMSPPARDYAQIVRVALLVNLETIIVHGVQTEPVNLMIFNCLVLVSEIVLVKKILTAKVVMTSPVVFGVPSNNFVNPREMLLALPLQLVAVVVHFRTASLVRVIQTVLGATGPAKQLQLLAM
eukprot:TRINITY_DN7207_c0_g1_i1.p2 TRINITY_DN7207_c0_g1~~TRINITY_DN7207_c0_g1_i1.p2  ORF type:complete len:128 (-),score=17.33 TRINITY_DN7207_c0_g1_i1:160-543(-)